MRRRVDEEVWVMVMMMKAVVVRVVMAMAVVGVVKKDTL